MPSAPPWRCKVGQPNSSQGGAAEVLLCFLLTVEVITSLVMQMSIPLFRLGVMQRSCQRRRIKTPPSFTFFFFFLVFFPIFFFFFLPRPFFFSGLSENTFPGGCQNESEALMSLRVKDVSLCLPLCLHICLSLSRSLISRFHKLKHETFAQAKTRAVLPVWC